MDQLMQMLQGLAGPSLSNGQQAYQSMLGGNFYGGVIPQTGMLSAAPQHNLMPQPEGQQPNKMTFGSSPWPGVWG